MGKTNGNFLKIKSDPYWTAKNIKGKPMETPIKCGMVLRMPQAEPELASKMTLGPGVIAFVSANNINEIHMKLGSKTVIEFAVLS